MRAWTRCWKARAWEVPRPHFLPEAARLSPSGPTEATFFTAPTTEAHRRERGPSLVAMGIPSGGGQVPEANLSPRTRTAMRVGDACAPGLLASVVGQKHRATVGCPCRGRRDRTAPCAVRGRARPVGGPRAGCPMRRACSRPRPANPPEKPASVRARFDVVPWVDADGHHVREHARSARRRARFSATLRPRAARGSRVSCPSWRAVAFGERETLTAPLSERVPWQ
jgi:hypothetical protein